MALLAGGAQRVCVCVCVCMCVCVCVCVCAHVCAEFELLSKGHYRYSLICELIARLLRTAFQNILK